MSGWSSSVPAAFCAAAGTLSRENLPSRNRNEMLPRSMGAWPSDDLSRSATDVPLAFTSAINILSGYDTIYTEHTTIIHLKRVLPGPGHMPVALARILFVPYSTK